MPVVDICTYWAANALTWLFIVFYCVCYADPLLHFYIVIANSSLFVKVKGKASPYSITERSVLELIPVLSSQPAGQ